MQKNLTQVGFPKIWKSFEWHDGASWKSSNSKVSQQQRIDPILDYTNSPKMRMQTAILNSLFRQNSVLVGCIHSPSRKRKVKELQSSLRRNQPLLMKRRRRSSSFEVAVSCKPGRWLIHFQPSSRLKETSRESRTSFPSSCQSFWSCSITGIMTRKGLVYHVFMQACFKPSGLS